jgi:hypothetical protein
MEMASTKPYSRAQQARRDQALTELVTGQNLPLSFVESDDFERYCKVMDMRYKVPTKEAIRNLIDDAFQRISTLLRDELQQAEAVSLTADL